MHSRSSRLNTGPFMCTNLNIYANPFFSEIYIHTPANKPFKATQLSLNTHTVVTVMIYEHQGFEGKQINVVRMHRRLKVMSHGQWQCHYDHLCQGHDPIMLDQLLRSITPFPDNKLERGLASACYQSLISNHIYTKVFHVIKLPQIQRK